MRNIRQLRGLEPTRFCAEDTKKRGGIYTETEIHTEKDEYTAK